MDIHLHYQERGSGEPLILLHGNGEDLSYFRNQIDRFAAQYRVIAVDTRGHGQSSRGDAPFTIRQFAVDLGAFMDDLGIPKAHILGFSDGGNIALEFALAHPERVDRLILNGANLTPFGVTLPALTEIVFEYLRARLASHRSAEAKQKADLYRLMVYEPYIRAAQLRTLHVRTLVIAGTDDLIRTAHTRKIARSLPDASLRLIPGDHCIALKEPEAFNDAVAAFLNA